MLILGLLILLPAVATAQCYYPGPGNCCPPPCSPCCPPPCSPCCPPPWSPCYPPPCNPCYPPPCSYAPAPCYPCNPCPQPCYQSCPKETCNQNSQCCTIGGFEIGADFLWWKPCLGDIEYAITSRTFTEIGTARLDAKYHTICPKWEPGVKGRINFPSQCGKWGFRGVYVWVQSKDTQTTNQGDEENSSIFNPFYRPELDFDYTRVRAHWNTNYHNFDAVLSYTFTGCECQSLTPFFGIGGLFLDQNIKTTMDDPAITASDVGTTDWDSYYWGLGLTVGSDYEYTVCEGFSFFGSGKATLIAGEPDTKDTQQLVVGETTLQNLFKFKNAKCCHIIPGYHAAAGIEYSSCGCGLNLGVRVGYEFVRWHNIPNPRVWISDDQFESTHPSVGTLGYHGLFAGIDLKF